MKSEMGGIFISYRRSDSAGWTGHLSECLEQCFGADQIFMDIEKIEAGTDFVEAIENAVGSCSILLAVIGPAWLASVDPEGRRRLDNPEDFIRLEIAAALQRNVRVIPVLVGGAAMPVSSELPDDLKPLTRRQAHELTDSRWDYDTEQLMKFIEKAGMKRGQEAKPVTGTPVEPSKKLSAKAVASIVISVLVLLRLFQSGLTFDMKIGGLVIGLVALTLGGLGFFDIRLQKTKGKMPAIIGMVLSGITVLVSIGLLSSNDDQPLPQPVPIPSAPSTPSTPDNVAPSPTQPPPALSDISGIWFGSDGLTYNVQQQRNMIAVSGGYPNELVITGRGIIDGRTVEFEYRLGDGTGGKVRLLLSPDGRSMQGQYRNMVTGITGGVAMNR